MTSKKLSLVILVQSLGMGGAEEWWRLLASTWHKSGIDVLFITTNKRLKKQVASQGVSTKKIPVVIDLVGNKKGLIKAILFFPFALGVYARYLSDAKKNSSTIIMSGFSEKLLVGLLNWWFKVPVIWVEFASVEPLWKKHGGWLKKWYLWVSVQVKLVITSSQASEKKLKKELGNTIGKKLVVIYCGVDTEQAVKTSKEFEKIRQQNDEFISIVCVSRLQPGKGQDILIEAFNILIAKYLKCRLSIVGEGDFLPVLEKKVAQYSLQKSVLFTGYVTNVVSEVARADIVVFPSVWELEGFGMVTVEAMALAKPVVAFAVGPTVEHITHMHDGYLVSDVSAEGLAKGLAELVSNEKLRDTLGMNGRKTAQNNYSVVMKAKEYLDYIEEVIR